jgi:tellurite resistance protein
MGLSGLSFAWRLASQLWHLELAAGEIIGALAIILFLILTLCFIIKFKRYSSLILRELGHPVAISFYGTIIISLLLIPGILLPYLPVLATVIWLAGTVLMLYFAWHVLRKWLDNQQLPENAVPAWILPIVGTLDVPIVGSNIPLAGAHEICLIFYGIGLVFTIILLTVIISRLLFQPALPAAIQPTLLILTGPFALAFSGYVGLTGTMNMFTNLIFYFNLFLFTLLASKIIMLPKVCPFYVSWWSVSFPMAAVTISTIHYAEFKTGIGEQIIAGVFLFATSAIIVFLLIQTFYRIWNGTFAALAPLPLISTP